MTFTREQMQRLIERLKDGPLQEGPWVSAEWDNHAELNEYHRNVQLAMLEAAQALEQLLGADEVGEGEIQLALDIIQAFPDVSRPRSGMASWSEADAKARKASAGIRQLLREREAWENRAKKLQESAEQRGAQQEIRADEVDQLRERAQALVQKAKKIKGLRQFAEFLNPLNQFDDDTLGGIVRLNIHLADALEQLMGREVGEGDGLFICVGCQETKPWNHRCKGNYGDTECVCAHCWPDRLAGRARQLLRENRDLVNANKSLIDEFDQMRAERDGANMLAVEEVQANGRLQIANDGLEQRVKELEKKNIELEQEKFDREFDTSGNDPDPGITP